MYLNCAFIPMLLNKNKFQLPVVAKSQTHWYKKEKGLFGCSTTRDNSGFPSQRPSQSPAQACISYKGREGRAFFKKKIQLYF